MALRLYISRMPPTIWFGLFLSLVGYVENNSHNLKVEYLENLIKNEVRNAESYEPRRSNIDLLGNYEESHDIHDYGTFDFIVIGGGTSGSVVSSRLSEVPEWKILLLEAGGLNDDFTDIPNVFDAAALSDRNWGYLTVPQKNGCFGRVNNQCPYIRGKILGGSGTINGLVYSRGIKADFDKWAEDGNPGWSWNDIFPYFKKLENFNSKNINLEYRGFGGPLNVDYVKPINPLIESFIKANVEIGIPHIEDYNAEKVSGVSRIQHNIKDGKRVSGANNYVRPSWNRFNFNVTLNAFVTKILINDAKAAYGVEFVKNGKKFAAIAKKEVILSGGAANSPQLLMLSGIGPKSDLQAHGIKVIQDLPVGQFMKDHIGFLGLYLKSNFVEPVLSVRELVESYLKGEAFYTAASNYRSISYYNSRNMSSPNPNIEIDFAPPSPIVDGFPQFANYKPEVTEYIRHINKSTHWNFQLFFLHPKSSGILTLKSANPRDFPMIDSRIYENKEDIEDMSKGIEIALKMLNTSVGKAYNLTLDLDLPSCSKQKLRLRAFFRCVLRLLSLPAYHLSSTVKMGCRRDRRAVVNHELKPYGVQSLRVVDVSIVPSTVTGHMNAQAFLIGEKAADMIKKDHQKQ